MSSVEVDALPAMLFLMLSIAWSRAGELLRERVELLPLARAEVGVDRDERERVGADELRAGAGRGRLLLAAAAGGEQRERRRGGARARAGDLRMLIPVSVGGPSTLKPTRSDPVPSSTWQTPSVIGSSIPSRCERSRRTGAVVRPSTVPISAAASSGAAPCAISSPAWRLRPWRLQQVTIRSPIPARPRRSPARAPQASPRRAISARPRAIRAALALSPRPSPSTPPAASAITFFAAAQSSTPVGSSLA